MFVVHINEEYDILGIDPKLATWLNNRRERVNVYIRYEPALMPADTHFDIMVDAPVLHSGADDVQQARTLMTDVDWARWMGEKPLHSPPDYRVAYLTAALWTAHVAAQYPGICMCNHTIEDNDVSNARIDKNYIDVFLGPAEETKPEPLVYVDERISRAERMFAFHWPDQTSMDFADPND